MPRCAHRALFILSPKHNNNEKSDFFPRPRQLVDLMGDLRCSDRGAVPSTVQPRLALRLVLATTLRHDGYAGGASLDLAENKQAPGCVNVRRSPGPRPDHTCSTRWHKHVNAPSVVAHPSGDPGYGGEVMGLHFYTWGFVLFFCCMAGSALALALSNWLSRDTDIWQAAARWTVWLIAALIIVNWVLVFAMQGFQWELDGDPTHYRLFSD